MKPLNQPYFKKNWRLNQQCTKNINKKYKENKEDKRKSKINMIRNLNVLYLKIKIIWNLKLYLRIYIV
jgi:hypothetical protein